MVVRPLPVSFETTLVVAACGGSRGIGLDGSMPWPKLSGDLKAFKALTMGHPVLMGSTTYTSIPKSARPLPGRLNIVLSSRSRSELSLPDSVLIAGSLDAAKELLTARGVRHVFVIGGESIYKQALQVPEWSQRIYYTHIEKEFKCDRYFPVDIDNKTSGFQLISLEAKMEEGGIAFQRREYVREGTPGSNVTFLDERQVSTFGDNDNKGWRHPEHQYLDLVRNCCGLYRAPRTRMNWRLSACIYGTGTAAESSSTNSASSRASRATWGLFTDFNGGTLAQNT